MSLENIKNLKKEVYSSLNSYSKDFVDSYGIEQRFYLGDLFHEFADNNVSIYYSDQKAFYFANEDICLNALDEYGYTGETLSALLKECGGLGELICKAGAIGEYSYIYNQLSDNESEMIKYWLLDYVEKHYSSFCDFTTEEIENAIDDVIYSSNNDDLDIILENFIDTLKGEINQ